MILTSFNDGTLTFSENAFMKVIFKANYNIDPAKRKKEVNLAISFYQPDYIDTLKTLMDNINNLRNIQIRCNDYIFKGWASKGLIVEINSLFDCQGQTIVKIILEDYEFIENIDFTPGTSACKFYELLFSAESREGAFLDVPTYGNSINLVFKKVSNLNNIAHYFTDNPNLPNDAKQIGYIDAHGKNKGWVVNSRIMQFKYKFMGNALSIYLEHTYNPIVRREE